MKINEITDIDLEENWKHHLASIGAASVLGLGGFAMKNLQPTPEPSQAPVVAKSEPSAPKIDIKKLAAVLPGPAQLLQKYALESGINNEELIQLIAQASHETLNFTRTEEIGNKDYFNKYDPRFNIRKAKILGNTRPGDGIRYKGRGFLQITGRWNYKAAGKALGLPLEEKPELLNDPDVAAKVSVWYWNKFVKPDVDDFTDVELVTKQINPGLKGLEDRENKYNKLLAISKS